jgi:hypothetical protein
MIRVNEQRNYDNPNWLIDQIGGHGCSQTALGQNPYDEPTVNERKVLRDESTSIGDERQSISQYPIAQTVRHMVSPYTYASVPSIPNNDSRGHESTTLSRFINNGDDRHHVNDNDCHSHLSRHTSDVHPKISPLTYIHYAEVPTRAMNKEEEGFYVGLLGIPNPTKIQIDHKKKSIETLKKHANDWGRQYLKNEFVHVSNTIMSESDLSSVQKFSDIKKMFQTFDHTNDVHIKVMSDIQYYRWMPPYHRSLWKLNMETKYMSENNLVYKERTHEEVKTYTIGCLAKLFTQIKVDLTKQLQCASKRKFIADSGKHQRGYVKKRKTNGTNAASSLPHVDVYVRPSLSSDEMSPITFEKSVSDFRELQKQNSILQQKLCDMEMRMNGQSSTFDSRLVVDWNDEQLDNEVSYAAMCVETFISMTVNISILTCKTLILIDRMWFLTIGLVSN